MGSRLYVGNLSYSTTEDKLRAAFEPYGTVASATIMIDRMSGRSRGFGFVEYTNEADAKKAIEGLHGADMDGRALTVNEARARDHAGRDHAGRDGGGRAGGPRPHRGPPMESFSSGYSPPSNGRDHAGRGPTGGDGARGGAPAGGDAGSRGRRGGERERRRHDNDDW